MRAIIDAFQRQRAVSRCVRQVAPRLVRRYGGGLHYTLAQLEAVLLQVAMPASQLPVAYAAFLAEAEFRSVVDPDWVDNYGALRSLYQASALSAKEGASSGFAGRDFGHGEGGAGGGGAVWGGGSCDAGGDGDGGD